MDIHSYVEKRGPNKTERIWLKVSYLLYFNKGIPITKPINQNIP